MPTPWNIESERSTSTVSVLFCDLVASTERQQAIGDDAADKFRRTLFAAMRAAADTTGGDVVKTMGDGLMIVFRASVVDAVACANLLHEKVAALPVVPPAFLRVGISAGETAEENDDWFGTPVVEAARLCQSADVGQTRVTEVVRMLVGTRGGHAFRSARIRHLEGHHRSGSDRRGRARALRAPGADGRPAARGAAAFPRAPLGRVAGDPNRARARCGGRHLRPDGIAPEHPDAAAAGYTPRVESTACSASVHAVVATVTCGYLGVPENRTRPERPLDPRALHAISGAARVIGGAGRRDSRPRSTPRKSSTTRRNHRYATRPT